MIGERLSYAMSFLSEAITVWLYMDYLFIRKRNSWTLIISFLVSYFILFEISALKNTTLNALTCCTANFLLIRLNYQSTRKAALLHTGFLCFIMASSEILGNLIGEVFGQKFTANFTNLHALNSLVVLSKLFYFTFATVGARVFAPRKMHYNSEPRFMILYCSLPVASAFIAILTVYLGVTANVTKQMGILMLTTTAALLFANLLFGVLYSHLEKSNNDYLTLQLSIQKEQADSAYYEALQEQSENQRILIHDIKRHLSTIDALAQRGGGMRKSNRTFLN